MTGGPRSDSLNVAHGIVVAPIALALEDEQIPGYHGLVVVHDALVLPATGVPDHARVELALVQTAGIAAPIHPCELTLAAHDADDELVVRVAIGVRLRRRRR